ncbi:MAG: TatD family hydrolase [Puniceicoccales bacterium]|jgi:TatD DNase family protein|nr:TatD family hydrolase [Puniceicoccales bacterium]
MDSIASETSSLDWIDTHCHPDELLTGGQFDAAWQRSRAAGVRHWIAIGTQVSDMALYARAAEDHDFLSFTVGLHPLNLAGLSVEDLEKILASWDFYRTRKGFVGVGEIGLDYSRLPGALAEREALIRQQKSFFEEQLRWAVRHELPVVVHARQAFAEALDILRRSRVDGSRVVFHCFSEGPEEVQVLNAGGMRASFTGIVTFKNADKTRAALKAQGPDRLLIETDAPYLAPHPHRGRPNEPAHLPLIAQSIASILHLPLSELSHRLALNSREFFEVRG